MPGVIQVEATPIYSSASNPAEREIKEVEKTITTMRFDMTARYGCPITAQQIIWPWLGRHAGWLRARYHMRTGGATAHKNVFDVEYSGDILPFGETVLFRVPKPAHRQTHGRKWHKADARMVRGIWVGKHDESNENLILTPEGLQRARTVKRLEPDKRADVALLKSCKGVPWATESRQPKVSKPVQHVASSIPIEVPATTTPASTAAPPTTTPASSAQPTTTPVHVQHRIKHSLTVHRHRGQAPSSGQRRQKWVR